MNGYWLPEEAGHAGDYRWAHGRRPNSRGTLVRGGPNKESCKTDGVWLGLRAVSSRHRGTMTECRRLIERSEARAGRWASTAATCRKWSPRDRGQKLQQRSHGGDCDALR